MPRYETLQKKADDLLKRGDALTYTNPAESRRLLRLCRHYRRKARALAERDHRAGQKEGEAG